MLARFFVDRPIFAWVISIVIILLGGVAVFILPIAQYPDITPPTVQVTATYPGANAQTVADSVAAVIEQQVNGVENMLYMSSQCTNDGVYSLTITFDLGTDLNMAQVLVQNRVSLAMPQLPREVQVQGVSTKKKSPSILLVVNLVSPDGRYDDLYLSNFATIQVKDELARLKGVGDISFMGQRDYSMRVWLDPEKMASRNLTTSDVVRAIQNQNVQVAAGLIGREPVPDGQQFQLTMSTLGRLDEIDQFADIILKTSTHQQDNGSTSTQVVRVRDVARIEMGAQQYDQISRLDGQPTVGMAIFQLPGSNALVTAQNIRAKMDELKARRFPEGIDYKIVYDTTPFINQSVEEVFKTLRDAVILVAIVVLLFLQDWKAMILPMIDVPVSLVGTFAVMACLGFTLNNLTLFGLVLAIGIVVDDAIVVLENIERLIATGLDARTATIKGMQEITGTIITITLVLCSVFLPCAFIPGVTGQFFRQFALTIAASMVISAINAMTLTPARAVSVFQTGGGGHGGGHDAKKPEASHAAAAGHAHGHVREALPWWFFAALGAVVSYMLGQEAVAHRLIEWLDPTGNAYPTWLPNAVFFSLFLPVLLMGGAIGWFIIHPVNKVLGRFFQAFNKLFDLLTNWYGAVVARVVRVTAIVLVLYGGLLYLTYHTFVTAPSSFIPMQDQGYLLVNIQLPDSASVQRTDEVMRKFERIVLGDDSPRNLGPKVQAGEAKYTGIPGVAHTVVIAGQSFLLNANGSNFGSCFVILDDFEHRRSHDVYDEVIARKIQQLVSAEIEDAVVSVFRAPPIQGLGSAGGFKFQVEQQGFVDMVALQKATDDVVAAGNTPVEGEPRKLAGLFSMFRAETPQLYVNIDRTKCESLQVDMGEVFNTLQVYMGGAYVNLFNKFGRTWQVNVLADAKFRTQPEYLAQLKVRNRLGEMVPLGTLADVKDIGGPVMVMRYNMYASAAINGNSMPGVSSGEAIRLIEKMCKDRGVPIEWTEVTYLQIIAGNVAILVFGLGTFLVYLVLAAKYESWNLPMSVILVVPMCLLCAIVGMLIARLPVDIFVQIGLLVLVGLAAKNAVLIVEFAEQLRGEGRNTADAIVESCRLRFRPIIMTSFAFILGVVPLMLGHGAGAEMRVSLGTAVFAGMLGVTFFGVFLTPVFYYALRWIVGATGPAKKPAEEAKPS